MSARCGKLGSALGTAGQLGLTDYPLGIGLSLDGRRTGLSGLGIVLALFFLLIVI